MNLKDVPWYVIKNDLIGGWSIGTEDKPMSQYEYPGEHRVIGDIISKEMAEHIIEGHNLYLRAQEIVAEFLKDK